MKRYTVPYMGKIRDVEEKQQWVSLKFQSEKFFINSSLAQDFQKFVLKYEEYCQKQLAKIIQSSINKLKYKRIKVRLEYKRGQEKIFKEVRMSIQEYLKEIRFKPDIEFKIGKYEKEWGINQINPKQKKFILFFNQELIKYDSGKHIRHVVAHELAHVFVRNHGPEFHKVLAQLDPYKNQSENFFKTGINKVFQIANKDNSQVFTAMLVIIILLIIGFLLYQFTINWVDNIFNNNTSNYNF